MMLVVSEVVTVQSEQDHSRMAVLNGWDKVFQKERHREYKTLSKAASNRGECKKNHGEKYPASRLVYLRGATSMADQSVLAHREEC